jgi:hypothetical protein
VARRVKDSTVQEIKAIALDGQPSWTHDSWVYQVRQVENEAPYKPHSGLYDHGRWFEEGELAFDWSRLTKEGPEARAANAEEEDAPVLHAVVSSLPCFLAYC